MRPDRDPPAIGLAAAFAQIANQFLTGIELGLGWLVAIEITDQTNAERDVVEVIAVDVAAVDLPAPAVADFNLAVAGGSAVADYEMISEPVFHSPDTPVVIIEHLGVSLPASAIVHDNEFPAITGHGRAAYFFDDRPGEVGVSLGTRFTRPWP